MTSLKNDRVKESKHTNTHFQSHAKKTTYWKHKYAQELRVLKFRGKNQARKDWNARTTKICLLMTQQCYSKHRNLNHSKLPIKNKTTWKTRARKTKVRGRGGNGEFNYGKRIKLQTKAECPKQNTEQHPNPHYYYLSPFSQNY